MNQKKLKQPNKTFPEKLKRKKGVITRKGRVISTKMIKTPVVLIEKIKEHPLYHKKYRVIEKIKVHDPEEKAKVGDEVIIAPCRPISKEKRWRIVKKIQKSKVKTQNKRDRELAKGE